MLTCMQHMCSIVLAWYVHVVNVRMHMNMYIQIRRIGTLTCNAYMLTCIAMMACSFAGCTVKYLTSTSIWL